MPLLIAMAALLVMYWGSQRNARMSGEIRAFLTTLCTDAAAGVDIAGHLNNSNPIVCEQITAAIKEVCSSKAGLASIRIEITRGDSKQFGNGDATHAAMLRVNGKDALGLRIAHREEHKPIEILGYWTP